ncbi:TonB-dependent receptor [Aliidongia dinghuensis]|uniref:TonB-dependent receptor n=1 Tax=Aliidongia dinghuensis TaxID=1867774 RepID=A0A8J3E3N5_9PROT|nr:TonB-dependent receptor [Aliidongia dinghuensis]GGF20165.1 TonB-dependent receptor [Aliidongia dinghuensis]
MRLNGFRIRIALSATLVLGAAAPGHADEPAEAIVNETIVVTGSAIKSADLSSEQPVTVVTAEELQQSSAITLQQYLDKVPALGFQGLTSAQNSVGTAGGSGNNFVDLRNLGPARTLVLVDGKRFPPSSTGTSEAVDLGNIPLSLIDHVEILRDGASTIYGSDAIGGVINIVLKKNFDGVEASAETGTSTHADGTSWDLSSTVGHTFDRGNLMLNVEGQETDPILQRTRTWARDQFLPIEPNGSLTVFRNAGGIAVLPKKITDPATGLSSKQWVFGDDGAFHPYSAADRYDLSTNNGLTIGQSRVSANALGQWDLTPDVTAYGEILFTDRQSETQKGPATLGLTPVTLKYPNGFVVPASAPGNPFGENIVLSKLFSQVGNEIGNVDATTYRILSGLRGTIWGRYDWDVSYGYGRASEQFKTTNALNFTHAEQEVGLVPCSAADVAAGCGLANMFGPHSLTQGAIDYLRYTSQSSADFEQHTVDGTITGDVANLPAGPLSLAIGGAYRRLSGAYTPDAVTLAGNQQGADTEPTAGGYSVREGFLEFKAPLLADLPLVHEFDASGSMRYSNYSNFGDAVTWKAGLDWQLTPDIRLRGARSTGFRAPSISELYLGRTSVSNAFNDPCDAGAGLTANPVVAANCRAQGLPANYAQPTNNYNTLLGGNPKLQPETSQNWTFGTVLTPRFIPGLSITADYFNIYVRNAISALSATTIVQTCYESAGLSDPLCRLISPRGGAGNLTTVNDIEANQGAVKTNGLDVAVDYGFDVKALGLGDNGHIELTDASTFTFSYLAQAGAGGKFVQLAGTVDQPTSATNPGSIPHFRSTGTLSYELGPARFAWTTRFIGGVHALGADLAETGNRTAAVFYHDIVGSYQLGRVTLIAGIDNLFDKNPPFYDDGTVNTSEYTYDVIGRFFYAKAVVRF